MSKIYVVCSVLSVTLTFSSAYSVEQSADTKSAQTNAVESSISSGKESDSASDIPESSTGQQVKEVAAPWEDFKKPSEARLRHKLSDIQYRVTQRQGTEPAFQNRYWNNHAVGIYVDIVSGEPLFSSAEKFDSGTGWPSFVRPIDEEYIQFREDRGFFTTRIEVRSKLADSHLGHVFDDGPANRGGKRYCMNSAALRFIPKAKMEAEGYGQFLDDLGKKQPHQR